MNTTFRARLLHAAALGMRIGLVGAAVAWFGALRPPILGGTTNYVFVAGRSMLPTFAVGDLVLAQPADAYETGSVVVYRIPKDEPGEGRLVVHRIVGGDAAGGFTTRGDNNDYSDIWHPRASDVLGTPIGVVRQAGPLVWTLRQPRVAATLSMAITLILAWPRRRAGETRSSEPAPPTDSPPPASSAGT